MYRESMKNMHTDVRVYRVNVKREVADKGIGWGNQA